MSAELLRSLLSATYAGAKTPEMLAEGNRVEFKWGDWSLRVYFEFGPDVLAESAEIVAALGSQRADRAMLRTCDRRITIASDSDNNLDHFNDFLFLLQDLEERLPGAVMFVPHDGTFFDVGGFN
jgi:hypothetical protein